jgi:branched-chain amino acid transport system substrate-binding protein
MKQVTRRSRGWWVLCALVLVAGACGSRDDDESSGGDGGGGGGSGDESAGIPTDDCLADPTVPIEGDTLTLASSYPESGNAASLRETAAGWQARFQRANEEGGVQIGDRTFQIEWEAEDDGYDPGRTSTNIQDIVGTDGSGAFAVFGLIGTSGNLAVRDFLNDRCIPNLHAASGAPVLGNPEYPWMIGGTNPVYTLESRMFFELLQEENPDAKVAMLVQDDDFGEAYEGGLREAIESEDSDIEIVAVERYQPSVVADVSPQMSSLAASGADTFFNGGVGLPCPTGLRLAAEANWEREVTWVSNTCLSRTLVSQAPEAFEGAYTAGATMDPLSPDFADEPRMQQFREDLEAYDPEVASDSGYASYGWTQADVFIAALEEVEEPTRLAVMEAYRNLDLGDDVGLIGPGGGLRLSADDHYMGERLQRAQFTMTGPDEYYFATQGEVRDFEGQAPDYTPEELITGG